jgi:uracil permease
MFKELLQDKQPWYKSLVYGSQTLLACLTAILLVPIICGLSIPAVLMTMGIATLVYIFVTGFKVPFIMGSSFAIMVPIITVKEMYGMPYVIGGLIAMSIMTVLVGLLIKKFGPEFVQKFLPPPVIGPIIMCIGIILIPTGVSMASTLNGEYSLIVILVAVITLATVIITSVFKKTRPYSVLFGFVIGAITCGFLGLNNFSNEIKFFVNPFEGWVAPKFNFSSVLIFCIVNIATIAEGTGDIMTCSAILNKPLDKDPGLWRSLVGDGCADFAGALVGSGASSTSYGENLGVIALTKNVSIWNNIYAAGILIILSFFGYFTGLINGINACVIGAISCMSYGLISTSGLRIVVASGLDYTHQRNLIITSVILFIGIGGFALKFALPNIPNGFQLSGIGLAAVIGVILNLILPKEKICV